MANGLVTVDTAPEASTGLGVSVSLARVLSPVLRKPGVGCRGRGRRQRASKGQTEVSHLLGGLVGKATSRFLAGVVTCRDSTPTVTRCPLVEGRAFRNAGGLRRCTCGIGQSGRGVPLLHVAEQTPLGHTGAEDQEPSVGPGVGLLPAGATQSTPIPSGRCQTSKGVVLSYLSLGHPLASSTVYWPLCYTSLIPQICEFLLFARTVLGAARSTGELCDRLVGTAGREGPGQRETRRPGMPGPRESPTSAHPGS